MINLRETCVFPLETQGLYSTARVHNFFRPGRNGNSVGSEVTHRPMAAEINRCRLAAGLPQRQQGTLPPAWSYEESTGWHDENKVIITETPNVTMSWTRMIGHCCTMISLKCVHSCNGHFHFWTKKQCKKWFGLLASDWSYQESTSCHMRKKRFLPLSPPGWRGIVVTVRAGGRPGGRLPNLRNPYLCNRLMDFLHSKFCGIV